MQPHDVLTIVLALAAVVGMIVLTRYATRIVPRLARNDPAGAVLRLEASLALDQKRRVCLVNCEGRRVLLLTGGTSDVMLGWMPGPGAVDRTA